MRRMPTEKEIINILTKELKGGKIDKIFEQLKQIPELKSNFSEKELRDETTELLDQLLIIDRSKNKKELRQKIAMSYCTEGYFWYSMVY